MSYVGRFAPSPSGPLHFGSLVAALGSYFQAKSHHGKWLVRMEDLDPPREMAGASDLILNTLEAYHLHWDDTVVYQSERHPYYQQQIEQWLSSKEAYYCQCTRKQIKQSGGFYLGTCRDKARTPDKPCSVRFKVHHAINHFVDVNYGHIDIPQALADEDFIIKRRDGLYAYNLAVVLDDIQQGVTEVVRGADLIEPTGRQINLYRALGKSEVSYVHLPLVVDQHGNKLSKQNHAPALNNQQPLETLLEAMSFLGFDIDVHIRQATIDELLTWGCQNWSLQQLPKTMASTARFSNGAS
ncbi:tRNA glutamyl-Q(34) synthetase GluQRS [Vibrio genomosp. F10]|uniref:Glutamyl-Q tRNA(Asp) synthetase n=2 Tax=Vibrio genomosp. F10 TaxID=723171 RepID=A0A1B9R2G6_9VIBR|nr:tRNA glutamyl-Q(34) synthetase GluQRS [Vibrio genomosp. F10]OCH78355.1 tRNA glutamyl-Q synthetase [Vibrio genomosp. F10]OEE34099.1 tRNA glutamyl-Q(34) synthetase GluQRS [Vibrio genomosp. F10 str. ZF-129]OEE93247.1 tRNA glutamyl-Q(34) synthetase GluQRS [Vibrio genomosp. F10 str. 9ZC157]